MPFDFSTVAHFVAHFEQNSTPTNQSATPQPLAARFSRAPSPISHSPLSSPASSIARSSPASPAPECASFAPQCWPSPAGLHRPRGRCSYRYSSPSRIALSRRLCLTTQCATPTNNNHAFGSRRTANRRSRADNSARNSPTAQKALRRQTTSATSPSETPARTTTHIHPRTRRVHLHADLIRPLPAQILRATGPRAANRHSVGSQRPLRLCRSICSGTRIPVPSLGRRNRGSRRRCSARHQDDRRARCRGQVAQAKAHH